MEADQVKSFFGQTSKTGENIYKLIMLLIPKWAQCLLYCDKYPELKKGKSTKNSKFCGVFLIAHILTLNKE